MPPPRPKDRADQLARAQPQHATDLDLRRDSTSNQNVAKTMMETMGMSSCAMPCASDNVMKRLAIVWPLKSSETAALIDVKLRGSAISG
jgi:hypothetical protein